MKTWQKIATGTVLGGAAIAGTIYLLRLKEVAVELETVPMVTIHKLDLTGLTIRVDLEIKNPTRMPMKIKFPFMKLLFRNSTVGSSQAIDQDISIPAFGEVVIDQIMIRIPLLNIFSLSGGLIQAVQNKEVIQIEARTLTTIDLGWKTIPFTKSNTVTLAQPQT
jgi:hypothetical protein